MNEQNQSSMFKPGDLVVGSTDPSKSVYSPLGARLEQDGVHVYGNSATIKKMQSDLSAYVIRNGGKPLAINSNEELKKPVRKKKKQRDTTFHDTVEIPTYTEQPVMEEHTKLVTVQFENDFGRIKAKLEKLVEQDLAFMLVFREEDDMVFEPKIGETLRFCTDRKIWHSVYYPGVTFDWPDSDKKFMILFKMPEENQE